MEQSIVQKIINEIERYTPKAGVEHVGKITSVGDGVVAIDGLSRAVMGEIVEFEETAGKTLAKGMDSGGALYGLILMPIGAVVFAEHWIVPKMGYSNDRVEARKEYLYWPALLTWIITLLLCYGINWLGLGLFFLWFPMLM